MSIEDIRAAKAAAAVDNTPNTGVISAELQASMLAAMHPTPAKQTFKALDIQRFVRADGSWLAAINDVFTPETQEDYDQLKYFEEKALVEEVK